MPKITSLDDLFEDMLKDVYYAEKKVLKALPKMAKKATSPELKETFESHREETEGQIERLEQIFEIIGKPAKAKKCEAIEGLTAEADEIMEDAEPGDVMDSGLIAMAQAVEHYEISRYGTLRAWAEQLGLDDAVELIEETLEQEKAADEKLGEVAEDGINEGANAANDDDEDAEDEKPAAKRKKAA